MVRILIFTDLTLDQVPWDSSLKSTLCQIFRVPVVLVILLNHVGQKTLLFMCLRRGSVKLIFMESFSVWSKYGKRTVMWAKSCSALMMNIIVILKLSSECDVDDWKSHCSVWFFRSCKFNEIFMIERCCLWKFSSVIM